MNSHPHPCNEQIMQNYADQLLVLHDSQEGKSFSRKTRRLIHLEVEAVYKFVEQKGETVGRKTIIKGSHF